MEDHSSDHWSLGLPSVIYQINTRTTHITRKTPYQLVFGQNPRSNVYYWRSLHDAAMGSDIEMNDLIIDKIHIMNSNIADQRSQTISSTNNTSKIIHILKT